MAKRGKYLSKPARRARDLEYKHRQRAAMLDFLRSQGWTGSLDAFGTSWRRGEIEVTWKRVQKGTQS